MKKSKTFARKIVAIVLAVLMAMSTFTGVLTVYAKSTDSGHDNELAANFMTWAETTDNQTCEALLDWVDDTLNKANIAPIKVNLNYVVVNINLNGYLDSVDGALNLVSQVNGLLNSYKGLVGGDVANLYLNPIADLAHTEEANLVTSKCGSSYRAVNNAKDIVMALAETIYWNSNDDKTSKRSNKNVIGQFIKGKLSLGLVNGAVDVYGLIGNLLNMWDGYESNLVYNMLAQAILTKTSWFTEAEVADFQAYLQDNSKGTKWNFDDQLLTKLTSEFISKISVEMTYALERKENTDGTVTYEPTDSSKTRYSKILKYLSDNNLSENDKNIAKASEALGYDPNLRYDKNGNGMIYLFRYGNANGGEDTLTLSPTDKFYDILNKALKIVWKTTLKPTLRTMRVNNSMDWYKGHGGNFDNVYYYWLASQNNMIDQTNWENNYTPDKFNKFLEAKYADYNCSDAQEFRDLIEATFDYDRAEVENPKYNWRDVAASNDYITAEGRKESILFGKLRYSPLADKVFNMQTGPINLYFMQTGFDNLETFIDNYVDGKTSYPNIVAALNNGLVAAVKDLFPNSPNIGLGRNNHVDTNLTRPVLAETGTNPGISEIASTLVSNTMKIFEYAANAADENILSAFYHNNNITDKTSSTHLTEANFEEAMIPLLVGCIKIVDATKSIHNEDFDMAKSAEDVAYLALREHLSYSQPKKDYDKLVTTASGSYAAAYDVNGDGNKSMFEDAILPMCRDAVGYLLSSIVPCRDKNGKVWDFDKSDPVSDKTTLFDLLNSVVCYYASTEKFTEPSYNKISSETYGKGVAALLGVVDENGECLVKMSNSLWQNLSEIANKIWPTIGTLQYGTASKAGHADAYELVYDTVVKSLINISDTHGTEKTRGLTTIVKQLLTIFTAEPIMNKGVDVLIYDDVVASLVNSIFGAKVSGQAYKKVIPTSTDMNTTTPFDSLVNEAVFARYKGDGSNENGVLGILISNIYCAFGGVTAVTNKTRGDGAWQGAMFAVKAVSYFVNGFLPQLGDHKFGAASISVNDPSRSNFSYGDDITNTYVTVKNESVGLNRFYKNANGDVTVDDRYFIDVTDLTSDSSSIRVNAPKGIIAPEKSVRVQVQGKYPEASQIVKFTLNYNIYKGTTTNPKKQLKYSNQTAVCYLNLSSDKGWYGTLTDPDTVSGTVFSNEGSQSAGENGFKLDKMVLSSTNPAQAETIGINVFDIDGVYDADKNNMARSTYTTETINDVEYVEATNVDKYDYRLDTVDADGNILKKGEWVCGDAVNVNGVTVYKGYTLDEVKQYTQPNGKPIAGAVTRTHVAASVKKGESNAALKPIYDSNGNVESVGIAPNAVVNDCATAASPINGINFVSFKGVEAEFKKWMKVQDQVSSIAAGDYTINLKGYSGTTTNIDLGAPVSVTVADTSGADTLQRAYQNASAQINAYQPKDYKDYSSSNNSSVTYTAIQDVFTNVLNTIALAPTEENAKTLSATTETVAATSTVKSTTGDPAYKPATTVSDKVEGKFYKKGNYYYLDENCKFPVFSNQLITDSDVTNGKDVLGRKVEKQGDVYYLVNDYVYEKAWDTTTYTYPYYGTTNKIAQYESGKDVDGNPIMSNYYSKEEHSYYNSNGTKVNASDTWAYTYVNTQTITKPNDGKEYRSVYAQFQDYMTYNINQTLTKIDTSSMAGITGEGGLMEERSGKESINYDVESYEKMVQVAKEAEALVTNTGEMDENGKYIYSTTATSAQLQEAVQSYKDYNARVVARGYEGEKLEAELAHLTGTTKANITATFDENPTTKEVTNGVVMMTAGTPKYGKIVNGKLVNSGSTVYSDVTWTNYVNALAKAVKVAKDAKPENISGTYEAKKNLVIAENALEEPKAVTTYTVTGVITEAVDGTGTAGTYGLRATLYNGSQELGRSDSNGKFTIELPIGETTTVTVKTTNGIARKVTFTEAKENVQIGIIAIDYNGDGKVNSTDVALASKTKEIGQKITVDQFKSILKSGVNYATLS
ncbi:MAG: hypothetical protein ACLR5R_01640 [Eubacterium sp.]|uniref:hypothetical protein n=1 Tax=Eubacterium sp. TaxID=142586 RepID=UPI0025BB11BA|nr:hypothetical protein [Eubacterium sp.]